MGIVKYNQLKKELLQGSTDLIPNLFLICGESFLIKRAFGVLSDFLLGEKKTAFSIENLEGDSTPLGDIIEQVSTFSFPATKKIISIQNMPLFQSSSQSSQIRYTESDLILFETFIDSGWPNEHILVIISEASDKRKKIYKSIAQKGWVIDCTVSQGARKADIDEQRAVLKNVTDQVLQKTGKQIDNQAFSTLVEMTGFNLDVLTQNLEKLSAYISDRVMISAQDIKAVVVRDKKDPIFNFTNAIMDKDTKLALFYLNSLIQEGFHPLQLLKSLENQFRKFLLIKDCLHVLYPDGIHLNQITFNQFKQTILPKITDQDSRQIKLFEDIEIYLTGKAAKKKEIPLDLLLAPNPNNAYPVFQVFKKSEIFSFTEIYHALIFLSDIDYMLKTSAINVINQIENFIIKLCSKGGFVYAQENQNSRHHF